MSYRLPYPSHPGESQHGFTLIELLIVVAIIAILAAIAVPNFLEAQTRAKVSRTKADMRSMATAIEAYVVDNNKLPRTARPSDPPYNRTLINSALTTPVAYITSVFPDIFNQFDTSILNRVIVWWGSTPGVVDSNNLPIGQLESVSQTAATAFFAPWPNFYDPMAGQYKSAASWLLFSAGPDKSYNANVPSYPGPILEYDPTNGSVSSGDVVRFKS